MGLNKLAQEDPSFNYSRDEETGQTVIEGMGELHLEIIVDRLRREFKVGGCVDIQGTRQRKQTTQGTVGCGEADRVCWCLWGGGLCRSRLWSGACAVQY